ncbi:hypothetical protein [Rhodococcoides fascians]|uniref:hypothetical protein n=1 Tax=Rhodococcoides fascians TaxID=1828 RepID=UPI0005668A37|nr:hypothetical protein [Rhodococcus fascians]
MTDIDQLSEYDCYQHIKTLQQFPNDANLTLVDMLRARIDRVIAERQEFRRLAEQKRQAEYEAKQAAQAAALAEWEADPLNDATIRGWKAMKTLAPGLDGVDDYMDLAPSLRCRYAAFTRAVLGVPQLETVVLSLKQEQGRSLKPGETELPGRETAPVSDYYCCEDCG